MQLALLEQIYLVIKAYFHILFTSFRTTIIYHYETAPVFIIEYFRIESPLSYWMKCSFYIYHKFSIIKSLYIAMPSRPSLQSFPHLFPIEFISYFSSLPPPSSSAVVSTAL